MVISGAWFTLLHIDQLSPHQMTFLASVLSQARTGQDTVLINSTPLPLLKSKRPFMYFATVHPPNNHLSNARVDSLKITRLSSHLSLISADLLDTFRLVHFDFSQLSSVVSTCLVVNGFTSALTEDILRLLEVYNRVLKTVLERDDLRQDKLDPSLVQFFIRQAAQLMHNNAEFKRTVQHEDLATQEKNALGVAFSNCVFPRVEPGAKILLMNYLKTEWNCVRLALRHQLAITNDTAYMNLPMRVDKETAMQIEDKLVLCSVNSAVAVATVKLRLAASVLFQSKCVNVIEHLTARKNVNE